MDAKTRAEKIVSAYLSNEMDSRYPSQLIRDITAQIEDAEREHEEELICEDCGYAGSRVKPSLEKAYAEGFRDGCESQYGPSVIEAIERARKEGFRVGQKETLTNGSYRKKAYELGFLAARESCCDECQRKLRNVKN